MVLLNPEQTAAPLYRMTYVGDYGFDAYLKVGSPTEPALEAYLRDRLPLPKQPAKATTARGHDECSAFLARNEQGHFLYARNLDLPDCHPAVLLWTRPPQGYASLSMVDLNGLGYALDEKHRDLPADLTGRIPLLSAPFVPRDGVNEHGLAVATLNVPQAEAKPDPAKVTICRWQVNRLLLDHARDVPEAIRLLASYNVHAGDSGVHFFVADAQGNSAVIEYPAGGAMTVTRNTAPWQAVTNFYLCGETQAGTGKERYACATRVLGAAQGVLAARNAMILLRDVSQASTVWSVVYDLSDGAALVSMGRRFEVPLQVSLKTPGVAMPLAVR